MRPRNACLGFALACAAALAAHASTVLGLTIEDQARLSKVVVIGEIAAQRGVDDPVNGLESEVTLTVGAALKGDLRAGQSLVFHTRSGELNGEVSTAIGEAVFHPGQKVLVFVEDIDGRLYNIGLSYGVFNAVESANGRISFVRAIEDGLEVVGGEEVGNGPFSLEEVRTRVTYAATHPRFDNAMVLDAFGGGR